MKVLVGWEWSPSYPQGSKRYRAGEVRLLGLGKSEWRGVVSRDRGLMGGFIDSIKKQRLSSR